GVAFMSEENYIASYCIRDVFLTGEAYRHGAEFLRDHLGQGPMEELGDFRYVITANHALALELYLKCLLLLDKRQPGKHHEVDKHFKKLLRNTQDAIRIRYKDIVRTHPYMQSECARLREAGEDPDKIFDLDNALRDSSKAFDQSRYPYDPGYKW